MEIRKISQDFAVSSQTSTRDLPVLKARGDNAIICNRPDGEGADRAGFDMAGIGRRIASGGRLSSSFPGWLIDGTRPSRPARILKERMLPTIQWKAMLRCRERMARPERLSAAAE